MALMWRLAAKRIHAARCQLHWAWMGSPANGAAPEPTLHDFAASSLGITGPCQTVCADAANLVGQYELGSHQLLLVAESRLRAMDHVLILDAGNPVSFLQRDKETGGRIATCCAHGKMSRKKPTKLRENLWPELGNSPYPRSMFAFTVSMSQLNTLRFGGSFSHLRV
jgi:hypothetical protein